MRLSRKVDASASPSLAQMGAAEFVDHLYRKLLFREPDEPGRRHWVAEVERGRDRLEVVEAFLNVGELDSLRRQVRFAAPGHFYSPHPSEQAVEAHHGFDWTRGPLPAIDYRETEQMALLERLAPHHARLPFSDAPSPEARYGYVNTAFGHGDAATLFCLIQHLKPRRIIEVGSGHSSCAILDSVDRLAGPRTQVTFVEPYPELLKSLLRPGDLERHPLHAQGLQECPLAMFRELQAGDILFIDSSHVSKLGSDVNYLFFEVLPALQPGVWVHVHDIFHPFEYPMQWYAEGRAWNEAYLLRAFLEYNTAWRIEYFSSFMVARHEEWFQRNMPVVLRNRGGHIWLSRI